MITLRKLSTPISAIMLGVGRLGLRTLFLTLGALTLLNVTFVIVASLMSEGQRLPLLKPPIIGQASAAAKLLDTLAPADRSTALEALNSPMLRFALRADFATTPAVADPAPVFVPIISAYAAVLGDRDFRVYLRNEAGWGWLRRTNLANDLIIVIRLADGSGLLVEASDAMRREVGLYGSIVLFSLVSLVLLGLMTWASLSYARPLERIATASVRFAERIEAGDAVEALPESGPKPVRDLTAALNTMGARLGRLMAERTTTLAAIAHDLRTYLTRLRMRSEFIDDAEQRAKAERDLEDMTKLIEDALWLGKRVAEPPRKESLDLDDWLRDFIARRIELGEPVSLAGDAAGAVEVSSPELARALNNLVDNALRYAGTTMLTVDGAAMTTIAIDVLDEGPGVPEAFLETITDPFTRLEGSRSRDTGGAGLGLAIAKALIERGGGTLTLGNRPTGGFRARIELPRADRPGGAARGGQRRQATAEDSGTLPRRRCIARAPDKAGRFE